MRHLARTLPRTTKLARYFVETSSFFDVVKDRCDIILGEKGCGKTALLRYLAEPEHPITDLSNTDLVVAFNIEGDIVFRQLLARNGLSEAALRTIWTTYFAALLGNHLLEHYKNDIDLHAVHKNLKRGKLLATKNGPSGVWRAVSGVFRELEVEGEVGTNKLPIRAGGRFRFRRDSEEAEFLDLDELLELEVNALKLLERRAWLLVDRVDEAFSSNRSLERRALRALLKAILDLGPRGELLRVKCCLRTDVFSRITESKGFVNATHLRRKRIEWDHEGIVDLVAKRIATGNELPPQLAVHSAELKTLDGRLAISRRILPASIDGHGLFEWMEQRTSDGNRKPSPRNIITLLGEARRRQLEDYDRDDPDYVDNQSLISEDAMKSAANMLSEQRLEDTVLAEFSHLRPAIEAMREKSACITPREFATAMNISVSEAMREMHELKDCGVVSLVGDVLLVPRLYRPALKSHPVREGKRTTESERSALEARARGYIRELEVGGTAAAAFMEDLDRSQCSHVSQYVRKRYASVIAVEQKGPGDYALFRIEMRLKHPQRPDPLPRVMNEAEGHASQAELRELVYPLMKQVLGGASVAISSELPGHVLEAVEQLTVTGGDIRVVARLETQGNNSSGQIVLAKDIPGDSLDEQDAALIMAPDLLSLCEYIGALADIVANTGRAAILRPHGPVVVAEIVAAVRNRSDVTYRMTTTAGGTAIQLQILRQS
jgi:hypothetical protein